MRESKNEGWSTHLGHKAEHAVDMETGTGLAVTFSPADSCGKSNSISSTSPIKYYFSVPKNPLSSVHQVEHFSCGCSCFLASNQDTFLEKAEKLL